MSQGLDNATRLKLETLLGMGSGYVLDFSTPTFRDFVYTSVGLDPYEQYEDRGSKANILRAIWSREPATLVAKLNLELLDRWDTSNQLNGSTPSDGHEQLHRDLVTRFSELGPSGEDLEFLNAEFAVVDLNELPAALSARDVVRGRLAEIENCLQAEAWLAVVLLVGSTLEGLLQELAVANASTYVGSAAAPVRNGKPKPLLDWKLAELIQVSREVGFLGEDVLKHAHSVREFRNYIHPRQQLAENFEPRQVTAEIAQRVLIGALDDLARLP